MSDTWMNDINFDAPAVTHQNYCELKIILFTLFQRRERWKAYRQDY